jgi:hypothetical protein
MDGNTDFSNITQSFNGVIMPGIWIGEVLAAGAVGRVRGSVVEGRVDIEDYLNILSRMVINWMGSKKESLEGNRPYVMK